MGVLQIVEGRDREGSTVQVAADIHRKLPLVVVVIAVVLFEEVQSAVFDSCNPRTVHQYSIGQRRFPPWPRFKAKSRSHPNLISSIRDENNNMPITKDQQLHLVSILYHVSMIDLLKCNNRTPFRQIRDLLVMQGETLEDATKILNWFRGVARKTNPYGSVVNFLYGDQAMQVMEEFNSNIDERNKALLARMMLLPRPEKGMNYSWQVQISADPLENYQPEDLGNEPEPMEVEIADIPEGPSM